MRLKIDNRSPVYLQVIQYFREQIASGSLAKGEEIFSRRELAAKLKINPNTVQRAYKEMEESGLIFTEGNLPSRVTTDENVIKQIREEMLTGAVTDFVTAVKALGIPYEEIGPLIKQHYETAERRENID